jgi:predicted GNAT family acetyltransferase
MEVDGHLAIAVYRHAPGTVTVLHTEVPEALGGRGIGSALIKGALDLIRARGEKLISRCEFTTAYIDKHPEYRDLLA